jgi:hypothetical protein
MGTDYVANLGHVGYIGYYRAHSCASSLGNKLAIKKLIDGTQYILMYSNIQCNEKLDAAGG